MDVKKTFETIALWLNSCKTIEQIDLCVDAATAFLLDRHNARKEFDTIYEAAEHKRNLPEFKISPETQA